MCSLITHRFLSVNVAGAETEYSGRTFQYPVLYIRLTSNVKQSSSSAVRLGVWYRIGGVLANPFPATIRSVQSLLSLPKPFVFANLFPVDLRSCF